MFKRLLKHQLKTTWKEFNIAYALMILISVFLGVAIISESDALMIIATILYAFSIFAVIGLAIKFFIKLFYSSTYGKRGFLTFTLPISTHSLILSKLVSSLLYLFGFLLSGIISFLVLLLIVDASSLSEIFPIIGDLLTLINTNPFITFLYIFEGAISLVAELVLIQFVCAYAQTLTNSKKKENMVFVIYIIASFVFAIIMAFDPLSLYVALNSETGRISLVVLNDTNSMNYISVFSIWTLLIEIGKMVGMYFWTVYIIDKKIEIQ